MWHAVILTKEETRALRAHMQSPTRSGGELAASVIQRVASARAALGECPGVLGVDSAGQICPIDAEVFHQAVLS